MAGLAKQSASFHRKRDGGAVEGTPMTSPNSSQQFFDGLDVIPSGVLGLFSTVEPVRYLKYVHQEATTWWSTGYFQASPNHIFIF
jgi:hypothetical protein